MGAKVSIIIPVYKTEAVVGRCLDSLKHQTFQDFEIVIVNDCTPDGAMKVVNDCAKTDGRIRIVGHTENKGLMCARRSGYEVATGKYYMFLDSDDTLPENALEILSNEIEKSGADIVISGFQYVWENQNRQEKHYPKTIGEFTPTEVFYKLLNGSLTHNLAFCIFNSDLFKHEYITIPNQTNSEDLILFYQLVANCKKIKSIKNITYNYCQDGVSSTRTCRSLKMLRQLVIAHNFKLNFLLNHNVCEEDILNNIVPKVLSWNICDSKVKDVMQNLDTKILSALELRNVFRYVTLRNYLVLKLRAFIINLDRTHESNRGR